MPLGRQITLAVLALLLGVPRLAAQGGTGDVTGRVVDAGTREPLAGVTVAAGPRQTLTGQDGRFALTGLPAGPATVRATRIGYGQATRTVDVQAGRAVEVEVAMASAALQLEGLVVIGYGERAIRDVTGSVAAVGEEDFNPGRVVSPEQLIQGKVAGVQVVESGEPGGGANIRIRGGTSVNASNEPLFVVDGVPLQTGGGLSAGRNPLNFINPADIARVTVLKDASSTAIYGARGANGVIIIETVSGGTGPAFSYSTSLSTSEVTGQPSMLGTDEFRAAVAQYAPERATYLGGASTDWRRQVQRRGFGQQHDFALSGTGDATAYRLSLGYLDQDGVIVGSTTRRLSGAFTYDQRLFADRLNVRANVRGARTDDVFTPGGVLGAATVFDPTQPIRTADGYYENTTFPLGPNNPIPELERVIDEGTTYRSVGSVEGRYRMPFAEGLSTTLRLGYDVAKSERRTFLPSTLQSQIEAGSTPGFLGRSNPSETTGLLDLFASYTRRLASLDSDLDATIGHSSESTRGDYPYFEARGLASDLLGTDGVPTAEEVVPRLSVRETKLSSFFGRVNYTLADRYLLTLSVRRDGSSRFGPNNQWGTFPAAAVAWRILDEPFMGGLPWLSELKLRASWGVNGNQSIGDYLWVSSYEYGDPFARVQFGDEWITTIRPTAVDPNIKWEETTSWNLGFDYGLFGDRVSGAVEYYVKDTDDLLFRIPVPAGTNLRNFVTTNVGAVRNRGVELSVNARVLEGAAGGISWTAGFNAATNSNRIVRINPFGGDAERILVGGIAGGVGNNIQVLQPGVAANSFYVYRHRRDAAGRPLYQDTNGDGTINDQDLYEDTNGDGVITQDDRAPFQDPEPALDPRAQLPARLPRLRPGLHAARPPGQPRLQQPGLQPGLLQRAPAGRRAGEPAQLGDGLRLRDRAVLLGRVRGGRLVPAHGQPDPGLQPARLPRGGADAPLRHGAERVHPHRLQRAGPGGRAGRHRQHHLPPRPDLLGRRDPGLLSRDHGNQRDIR
jgi:TonB-dependent starch-binding outer membrane protein SusC